MKEALEGRLPFADVRPYLDACLGCLVCEPACPSGVSYRHLLHPFRDHARGRERRPLVERLRRRILHATLADPSRFRLALQASRMLRPFARHLPARLRNLLELAPRAVARQAPLPELTPAAGPRRARVALLVGCVQEVLRPGISRAVVRVLQRNGVEVVVPRQQGCCGALMLHDGEWGRARAMGRKNLALAAGVDAVVSTAAGCGSGLLEYPELFRGLPEEGAARELADKVVDVSLFLARLGITVPPALASPVAVAYQDACHLAQAQGVREEPRRLLLSVEGLRLVPVSDADLCCGSAGIYNLEHPELSSRFGSEKAKQVLAGSPQIVASGNIGCIVQLEAHLTRLGQPLPVLHVVEVLDRAYAGRLSESSARAAGINEVNQAGHSVSS
jgi:glycolate oxidase iron-sulfur subunit